MGREISPKHTARLHSMEPPQSSSNGKKIVINSARGPAAGNYS